jgi:hypothetical protein
MKKIENIYKIKYTNLIFFKQKFQYKPTYEVESVWEERISQSMSS